MPAQKQRRPTRRMGSDGWVRHVTYKPDGTPAFLEFSKSYGTLQCSIHRSFPAEDAARPWTVHLKITGPRMSGSFDTGGAATLTQAMRAARSELRSIVENAAKLLLTDAATSPVLGQDDGP